MAESVKLARLHQLQDFRPSWRTSVSPSCSPSRRMSSRRSWSVALSRFYIVIAKPTIPGTPTQR
jgi:hypothetical protein